MPPTVLVATLQACSTLTVKEAVVSSLLLTKFEQTIACYTWQEQLLVASLSVLHIMQVGNGQQQQQHGSTVGMAMAVPHPPPAFLLAGQTADEWLAPCKEVHGTPPLKHAASDRDSDEASGLGSAPSRAKSPPAIEAMTVHANDSDESVAAGGLSSVAAGPNKAATERGGPVYLEQPDGTVQLKLLRNPLYRPPVDAEDGTEDRNVPLYQAVLDGTYQVQVRCCTLLLGSCPSFPAVESLV